MKAPWDALLPHWEKVLNIPMTIFVSLQMKKRPAGRFFIVS